YGGWILSTEKLNKIIDIEKKNKSAVLECGVVVKDFLKIIDRENLFYPPFPTEKSALIGGNAATNASGEYSFKYGSTRSHIKKINVILPSGEMIGMERGQYRLNDNFHLPDKNHTFIPLPGYSLPGVKNTAGYHIYNGSDLIDLFIGSEGTLGLISRVEISLIDRIPELFYLLLFFPSSSNPDKIIEKIRSTDFSENMLIAEYFDCNSLRLLKPFYPSFPRRAGFALLLGLSGLSEQLLCSIKNNLSPFRLLDDWLAATAYDIDLIYKLRLRLPEEVNKLVKSSGYPKLSTDIAVPSAYTNDMRLCYEKILQKNPIRHVIFGHIGENHLHVNLMPENKKQFNTAQIIYRQFLCTGIHFGGTISAEHGIGKKKSCYLPLMFGSGSISEMKNIKNALDPDNLFCRGNIFPESCSVV
ncbi:MAG: hypothetical protein A2096_15125, partial [Spirochaetes bacterium GWF1_41_5]